MAERKRRRKKAVAARRRVAEKSGAQPESADVAVPEDTAAARSAFPLRDETVEVALTSREHAGILEDYFGEAQYRELQRLAGEASSRSVRGGPRVLIVPGIMGSKIGRERKFVEDVIWIDPVDIAAGKLMDLRLNGADPQLKALGVILFAYLKLKLLLKIGGYDADFHPFDWRKSLTELGQELATRVNQDNAQAVHIVAHSMGGLVTRAAISAKASKIDRIIMLGTPNFGSFAPVQVLRAAYPVLKKIAFIDGKHSPKDLVQDVFRTFPSLYEMLPWPEKFALTDLYSSAGWPTSRPTPVDSLLTAARAVQQSLAPADDRFYLIAGVNQETVVSLRKEGDEFVYDVSYEGDGTVPLAMAELPGANTFFVDESHGSLPNNGRVAKAVEDLLATGTTTVLPDTWAPSRAGYTRSVREADFPTVYYDGSPGRAPSLREQRLLLQEFVSPLSRADIGGAAGPATAPTGALSKGFEHEFDRIVIGRRHQHQLEIRLAHGSIVDVEAEAYVLGMFRDVSPSGAAQVIDAHLGGAIQEFVTRRMFTGNVGEISIIPTGRHALRADLVAFAGLGTFDKFNPDVLELVAENLIRTFLRTKVDDFAIVLFGGASGQDPVTSLQYLLKGFLRGLRTADVAYRFHGVTVCETDQGRYDAIKRELYRLSSTALFDQVEVIIDEIQLPPPVAPRIYGARAEERREPVYLIARCDQSKKNLLNFESSVLTAGAKATVVKGQREVKATELQLQLEKIRTSGFTFAKLEEFGGRLSEMILPKDITSLLSRFSEYPLVVVHDAMASRIPWETVYLDTYFPAAAGGLSRRYLADNLSVAKWLSQRQQGATLDVLLVVNPTQDLSGAEEEGERIVKLFGGHASSVKLTVLRGPQAQKSTLRSHFASGEFDIVHYAGHAYFDPDVPANSGILCHGSQVLSGAELAGIGNLPSLMFFNACEAGRIRKPEEDDEKLSMEKRIRRNVGLAEAFLRGGIANYLGTYWPVGDEPAKLFAEKFYSELLDGRSVGDALLAGRQAVQSIKSVDWADYVHYGSPDFVIKL
jgi:pimeloyl-ACP methyl ester carboxylesterase